MITLFKQNLTTGVRLMGSQMTLKLYVRYITDFKISCKNGLIMI